MMNTMQTTTTTSSSWGYAIEYPPRQSSSSSHHNPLHSSSISSSSHSNCGGDEEFSLSHASALLERSSEIPADTIVVTIRQTKWNNNNHNMESSSLDTTVDPRRRQFMEGLEEIGRLVGSLPSTIKQLSIVHALDVELYKQQISPRRRHHGASAAAFRNHHHHAFPNNHHHNHNGGGPMPMDLSSYDCIATPILDFSCESILLKYARHITRLQFTLSEQVYERSTFLHLNELAKSLICHPTLESITFPPDLIESLATTSSSSSARESNDTSSSSGHRALQFAILSLPLLKDMDYPHFFDPDLLPTLVGKPSLKRLCVNAKQLQHNNKSTGGDDETAAAAVVSLFESLLGSHPQQRLEQLELTGFAVTDELCQALTRVLQRGSLQGLTIDGIETHEQWLRLIPCLNSSCSSTNSNSSTSYTTMKSLKLLGSFASRTSDATIGHTILSTVGVLLSQSFPRLQQLTLSFPKVKCPFTSLTNFLVSSLPEESQLSHLQVDFNMDLNTWPKQILPAIQSNCALTHFSSAGLTHGNEMLLSSRLRSLMDGILKMNQAGRRYILNDLHDRKQGLKVLSAVNETSLDCVYLHLLENPFLCYNHEEEDDDDEDDDEEQDDDEDSEDSSIDDDASMDEDDEEEEDEGGDTSVERNEDEDLLFQEDEDIEEMEEVGGGEQGEGQLTTITSNSIRLKNPNGSFHERQKRKLRRIDFRQALNLTLLAVLCCLGQWNQDASCRTK